MCNGMEIFGEALAPDSSARRIWKVLYYLVLAAIFFGGLLYAIQSGAFD